MTKPRNVTIGMIVVTILMKRTVTFLHVTKASSDVQMPFVYLSVGGVMVTPIVQITQTRPTAVSVSLVSIIIFYPFLSSFSSYPISHHAIIYISRHNTSHCLKTDTEYLCSLFSFLSTCCSFSSNAFVSITDLSLTRHDFTPIIVTNIIIFDNNNMKNLLQQ